MFHTQIFVPAHNENGQATTAALIILPLALAVSIGFFLLAQTLQIEARTTAACRQSMVKNQEKVAEALENLVKLNRWAQLARRIENGAEVIDKITTVVPIPHGFLLGKLIKLGSMSLQSTVMAVQHLWLSQGRLYSRLAPAAAEKAMNEALPNGMSRGILGLLLRTGKRRYDHPAFHLTRTPAKSRTPDYHPAPGFERSQTARVRVLLTMPSTGDIELGCAVSLIKKGEHRWVPQIREDRLLSN